DICQYRYLSGVVVHLIVGRELVVPLQLARVRIEGDHAVRIEIVTQADRTIAIGRRIARSPEGQIRFWVVSSGVPDSRPAGFPRVSGPRFVTNLAGFGNGVEAPDFFSRLGIKGGKKGAYRAVSACGSDDDLVLDDQWCVSHRISRRCRDRRVPDQLSN